MDIQWFPGHMAKAKRLIVEDLKVIDVVLETIDARAPISSSNDDLNILLENKTIFKILAKSDLASPQITSEWLKYFAEQEITAFAIDSLHRSGLEDIKRKLKDEQQKISEVLMKKGRRPRPVRILVSGIPNVGKSSLINALVKKDAAKTADVPGYTKGKQWVRVAEDIDLLDTPGIMPPKFSSDKVGKSLAALGCIKSEVFSEEDVAGWLLTELLRIVPKEVEKRYRISEGINDAEMLSIIAVKIGALFKGNVPDVLKAARYLLKEFQVGKLGRISLERP